MDFSEAVIAYSLPGSKEFLVGSVSNIKLVEDIPSHIDYDFIISPFNSLEATKYLIKFSSLSSNRVFEVFAEKSNIIQSTTKANYSEGFNYINNQIASSQLTKAILSKVNFLKEKTGNLYPLFIDIKNKYVDAFTYIIKLPDIGVWIGASPELVMKKTDKGILTRAIAGTQSYAESKIPLTDISWGEKEIEEHKIIERFLAEELEKKNIAHAISPSYSLAAGKVCHICSDIKIGSGEDAHKVLRIIHPGPALSGFPKDKAIETISEIEAHSRQLYCGYLGPFTTAQTSVYANIRCMEVYNNGYLLYTGGGITSESKLEDEWVETEMKASTLMTAILAQDIPTN